MTNASPIFPAIFPAWIRGFRVVTGVLAYLRRTGPSVSHFGVEAGLRWDSSTSGNSAPRLTGAEVPAIGPTRGKFPAVFPAWPIRGALHA